MIYQEKNKHYVKDFFKNHKKFIGIILAIIAFAAITLIYFSPVLEGKRIKQHDIEMHKGMSKEIIDYKESTGEQSLWTNSMFGGMPAWNISVSQNSNLMTYVNRILTLGFPHPIGAVFISMLGFFILMLVLDANVWVSFIGALAYGFTSYLFIVIGAGHNTKAMAMAYMAPVIAGILLTYKGKYIWGSLLAAIAVALEVRAGHLQITYYLLFIIVCIVIGEIINTVKNKQYTHFLKVSGILVLAAIIGIMANIMPLYANYEFGKETMRGKPILTRDINNQTKGLDKDYITQWSYGIGETWSLMIPNAKGGASGYIGKDNEALKNVDLRYRSTIAQQNAYWGDQPGTSGPVYVGAIIVFLFVLGLFVVKNKYKWILLAATVLSILLSWGKNFIGFTDFFLDYIPGYDKFRAVSMTLVIAEICMPLLACLALSKIIKHPEHLKLKYLYIAFGLTGGLCLLFILAPNIFFNFLSKEEAVQFHELISGKNGMDYQILATQLENVRIAIFRKDTLRSFLFITVAAVLIFIFYKTRIKSSNDKIQKSLWKPQFLYISLIILVIIDMYTIDKRYLNNNNFISKRQYDKPFVKSKADQLILQDPSFDYRVVNLTKDVFNDASTSYFHKSIGGYHGAKLHRYQDIISHYLSSEIKNFGKIFQNASTDRDIMEGLKKQKVLNMLNTKYIIYNPETRPLMNPQAFGNAWIVNDIKWVDTPNEEIDAIATTDVRNTAIINREFQDKLSSYVPSNSKEGSITMNYYRPNEVAYNFNAHRDELVVFSEIWTSKGWRMYLDGVEHSILRADYFLRSALISAGNHEIMMRYEPKIWRIGNIIMFISSLIIILGIITVFVYTFAKKKKET